MLSILCRSLPSLDRTTPFEAMFNEMDRLLGAATNLMEPARQFALPSVFNATWPALNLWRDGDQLVAEAEIPGFSLQDVEVLATDDSLTIRGQRQATLPENATALRVERTVNRFERTVQLPVEIDAESVSAHLNNGVLRITLPLAETARPHRVQIQALPSGPSREALPAGSTRSGKASGG